MLFIIIALHILVSIALILIVLLQKGKGADMGATFGGSSQTIFGSAGATPFLSKITAAAAIVFMITCLLLAVMYGKGKTSSIMKGVKSPAPVTQQQSAPAEGQGDTQAK